MPKYEVWEYKTYASVYWVEADSRDDAIEIYTTDAEWKRDTEPSCEEVEAYELDEESHEDD